MKPLQPHVPPVYEPRIVKGERLGSYGALGLLDRFEKHLYLFLVQRLEIQGIDGDETLGDIKAYSLEIPDRFSCQRALRSLPPPPVRTASSMA